MYSSAFCSTIVQFKISQSLTGRSIVRNRYTFQQLINVPEYTWYGPLVPGLKLSLDWQVTCDRNVARNSHARLYKGE
jgi:hypothetical protein